MAYIVDGPTTIGDTTKSTILKGNMFTPDLTTVTGDTIYCSTGATGALSRLAIGSNGQVLTVAAGLPSWAAAANSSTTPLSFSAFKSGTQAIVAGASSSTTAQITGWSTAAPGFDGTSGQFASDNFTPTVTGTYLIIGKVAFVDTNNSGSRTLLIVDTTSATTLAQEQVQPTPDIAINQQVRLSAPVALTASHVIQLQFTNTAGAGGNTSTIQASPSTFFSVIRLS